MNRITWKTVLLTLIGLTFLTAHAGEEDPNLQRELNRAELKTRSASLTEHEIALTKELREGELNRTLTDEKRDNLRKMIEVVRQDREELMKKVEIMARQQPDLNDPEWQDRIRKSLEQKVSFEFADVQLNEAIAFFRQIAGVNMIVDPTLAARKATISLKAQDMPLRNALDWISKMSDANWKVADHALFIGPNNPDPRGGGDPGNFNGRLATQALTRALDTSAKLRVKLANGTEIETEGSVLNEFPELMQEILGQLHDTTKDGILVYRLDDPARADLLEKAKESLQKFTVTLTHNPDLKLLVVTGEDPVQLRRAQAVLNVLLAPPKPPRLDKTMMTRLLDRDVMMKMNREFKNPDPGQPGQPDKTMKRGRMQPDAPKPPEPVRENF